MKRFTSLLLLASSLFTSSLFVGVLLTSCDGRTKLIPEEEVRNYGKYFVEKLNANQVDSLKASYPDIAKADSIVPIKTDSIMVAEVAPRQFDLTLAEGIILKITRSEDGNISVTESRGLFAFPADKIDIAQKTGMWDDNLSDAQLNERMKDDEFFNHMASLMNFDKTKIISIGKAKPHLDEEGIVYGFNEGSQTLTNLTNKPISGKDYSVKIKWYASWPCIDDDDPGFDQGYSSKAGKDIPPHGKVTYKLEQGFRENEQIVDINWKLSSEQLKEKFFYLTGKEYQEYLDSKK